MQLENKKKSDIVIRMSIQSWPLDARGAETTICKIPFDQSDLARFAEIAAEDLECYYEKRPDLKGLRVATVLAEDTADHYVNKNGFRCISVWSFFKKKEGVKDYHPLRHSRTDIGYAKFGHSSWVKHPGDEGFIGRGVNHYGRSIRVQSGKTIKEIFADYVQNDTSQGAARLKDHKIVMLWPECGEVIR